MMMIDLFWVSLLYPFYPAFPKQRYKKMRCCFVAVKWALATSLLLGTSTALLSPSYSQTTVLLARPSSAQPPSRIFRESPRLLVSTSSNDKHDEDDDDIIMQSLQNRIHQQETTLRNLETAQCQTTTVQVPETTRQIAVDYPVVACGHDDVYVVHLERGGEILARTCTGILFDATTATTAITDPARIQRAQQRLLCEEHTAGDVLAVELQGSYLVEARTSGGVHVHRLSRSSNDDNGSTAVTLVSQGRIPGLHDVLVTALRIQDHTLWVATDTGVVEAYDLLPELPLSVRHQPNQRWTLLRNDSDNNNCIVTSLSVHADLGVTVATTDNGMVHVLSMEDNEVADDHLLNQEPMASFVPPFAQGRPGIFPTCATVVVRQKGDDEEEDQYDLVCGANDGSLSVHQLSVSEETGEVDRENPLKQTSSSASPSRKLEGHLGPVKCLTSPAPGMLLSGALDGTMRLTNVAQDVFLYHITGYSSSTLGSLWSDGTRIVSNGSFNNLNVYDFSGDASSEKNSKRGRDDWNEDGAV